MQTVQQRAGKDFLGADCADFGCRLCSNGPGLFFLGADCAAAGPECFFWVQTVQQRARNVFFWVQTVQTLGADRDKDSAAGPE